jgi:hypothetical protein
MEKVKDRGKDGERGREESREGRKGLREKE